MKITAEQFEKATGRKPQDDDLERVNCPNAGMPGHLQCGWNHIEDRPVYEVGTEVNSIANQIIRVDSHLHIEKIESISQSFRFVKEMDRMYNNEINKDLHKRNPEFPFIILWYHNSFEDRVVHIIIDEKTVKEKLKKC